MRLEEGREEDLGGQSRAGRVRGLLADASGSVGGMGRLGEGGKDGGPGIEVLSTGTVERESPVALLEMWAWGPGGEAGLDRWIQGLLHQDGIRFLGNRAEH